MLKKLKPEEAAARLKAIESLREQLHGNEAEHLKSRKGALMGGLHKATEAEQAKHAAGDEHGMDTHGDAYDGDAADDSSDDGRSNYALGGEVRPMPPPEDPHSLPAPPPERPRTLPPDAPRSPKKEREPKMAYAEGGRVDAPSDAGMHRKGSDEGEMSHPNLGFAKGGEVEDKKAMLLKKFLAEYC